MHGDRGDIVVGWLTKIVVAIALVGVCAFEVVSIAVTKVSTKDDATTAAFEASQNWFDNGDLQQAFDTAEAYALEHGGTVDPETFDVASDGRVTLTMRKEATSLILRRISAAKKWLVVEETADAKATP
jgi:hypothetical protein